jgi:hypothetical protein
VRVREAQDLRRTATTDTIENSVRHWSALP